MIERTYRQLGYNLVEMAIALVVLGILLSGALVPLQARFEQEEINSTKEYMEEVKESVLAFALRHGTIARKYKAAHDGVVYDIPAGRPYLPCPDIDNDGLENRVALTLASPAVTIVNAIDFSTTAEGNCEEQKGALPWKTLGIRDVDSWGNRLSYRVDPAFSDSIFGFDESTRADIVDRRATLVENAGGNGYRYAYRSSRDLAGNIICSEITDYCPTIFFSNVLIGIINPPFMIALTLGSRVIPSYDAPNTTIEGQGLIDGAVFVLVSHGSNGYGAINRNGERRCMPSDAHLLEIFNAYYRSGHTLATPISSCASFVPPGGVGLQENLFISAPISDRKGNDVDNHDDIVMWAGSNETIGFLLRGGELPIGNLGFLPQ